MNTHTEHTTTLGWPCWLRRLIEHSNHTKLEKLEEDIASLEAKIEYWNGRKLASGG